MTNHQIIDTGPFYSMFNVGNYTFAPYKVVWREQAASLTVATVLSYDSKPIIPDHKLMLIDCTNTDEAFYICGILNSSPARYAAISYAVNVQYDPHILENIYLPKFNAKNKHHLQMATLSAMAHKTVKNNDEESIKYIEKEIDVLSAFIWGLSKEELKEIKLSLEEYN